MSDGIWSEEELKASVEVYAEMYRAMRDGRRINKAKAYRDLEARFDRNHKAFERRMQNISHVVVSLGGDYVKGLKPLSNIGPRNEPIIRRLVKESGFLDSHQSIRANTTQPLNWEDAETKAIALQKEWSKSGKKVTPPNGFPTGAEKYTTETKQRKRCAEVKAWVRLEANGICEACGKEAPFITEKNGAFLEVHHVVQLSDEGPDTVDNAIAVCPNCHRKLHLADNKEQLTVDLYSKIGRLRRP